MPLLIEPEPGLLHRTLRRVFEIHRADRLANGRSEFRRRPRLLRRRRPARLGRQNGRSHRHYHFEDIAATRVHQHLVPGRGAIDFAATLAAIDETGYDGWLTVELYPYLDDPDAAAREAKAYLEPLLADLTFGQIVSWSDLA